jgi:hypothetical protein
MTIKADAWQHLGALLIQRRTALSPRFHNRGAFCEATGLKYRLVYDIEEHRRTNFGGSTIAAIEAAYQLAPGSVGRFLAGGELQPLETFSRPPEPAPFPLPPPTPAMARQLAPFLAETEARVRVAQDAYPGQRLSGRQVFPDNPEAATYWDALIEARFPPEQLGPITAVMLARSAEAAEIARRQNGHAAGLIRRPVLQALR